jgi:hypothetical protein
MSIASKSLMEAASNEHILSSAKQTFNGAIGDRVREHTAPIVNRRIDLHTQASVADCTRRGRDAILQRLAELDYEWDVDRALMANFAVAGGAAFLIGITRYAQTPPWLPKRKGFLYLLSAQLGFLLVHATVGWCPPASLFRRLGFRTAREIEAERRLLLSALPGTLATLP